MIVALPSIEFRRIEFVIIELSFLAVKGDRSNKLDRMAVPVVFPHGFFIDVIFFHLLCNTAHVTELDAGVLAGNVSTIVTQERLHVAEFCHTLELIFVMIISRALGFSNSLIQLAIVLDVTIIWTHPTVSHNDYLFY